MRPLTQEEISEIENAIINSPLDYTGIRQAMMAGLSPHFRAIMPASGLPAFVQLTLDLNFLNEGSRLSDGSVPLEQWLAKAGQYFRPFPTVLETIQRMLDTVDHRMSGSPVVDVAHAPETKEVIVHQDDMVSHAFLEAGLTAALSVAKLMVTRYESGQVKLVSGGNPAVFLGTGWLLAPTVMITNHHVVNARHGGEANASDSDLLLQAASTKVKFDFNDDWLAGVEIPATELLAWNVTLDYAVFRVPATGRAPLLRTSQPVIMNDGEYRPVNIIQHPEGTSKKFAIRNNLVTAATATDVRYFTDTKQGSSGSPVLDDTWQVVALHRGSTVAQNVKFQGKSVAWVNIGTQITAITADLAQRFPAVAAELLV